ncbi:MAG: hypothetical protein WAW02_14790 [Sideroxyarcus sp.]
MLMIRIIVTTTILLLPLTTLGADRIRYLKAKKSDPGELCQAIGKKFPLKLEGFRKLGKLEKETVRPDSDYCYEPTNQCRIYDLEFTGLSLQLIEKEPNQNAGILTIKITGNRWDILGKVHVGQKISEIESYYGVKIPNNVSPIGIIGDCLAVVIYHEDGLVTGLNLDCQSC